MECDKNPFLEMTQDQIKKLDEVLQSDQAKALLEEAAKKLIDTRSAMDDHTTIHAMESIGSLSDFDTLDLQSSSRSGIFTDYEDAVSLASDMLHGQLSLVELIVLEHSYAIKPTSFADNISENPTETVTEVVKSAPNTTLSTNRSPIRRSLRVIEKVERKQTEKVKTQSDESPKKGRNHSFEEKTHNGERRMSLEITENITQFTDKKQQSHIIAPSTNNLPSVESDEDSKDLTNENINSKHKTGGRVKKRTSSEIPLRERKSKRLGLAPSDKIEMETKSSSVTKEVSSPPGKQAKGKLSPKKRGTLSAISNAEKQAQKFKEKNASFVNEKIDDEIDVKPTRKRNSSLSAEKGKINRNRQSPDNVSRAKRKKSLSSSEEYTKILSKKENSESDNKDLPEQEPQPLPSPSVQKPKPVKKIKRDSVTLSLGFEPALFSQPDVMVKIKSDESPIKKLDKENEEMTSKAIDSLLEPLSQREMNQLMEETLTPRMEKTEMSNEEELIKDVKNNSSDSPNAAIEKDLPMFKDLPLTNDVFNNSESELSQSSNQNLSSLSNAEDLQENVEDVSPSLSSNNEVAQLPRTRKVSQQFVKRDSVSERRISQDSKQKVEDDKNTDKSKTSENDTSSNKSNADVKEDTGPTPERKSRRIIKRKEFFEEMSFQETKRTLKKNAQAPNVKKPSGEQTKKSNENDKLKKVSENDSPMETDDSENDDDDEMDSDWSSEDDPEKLWCICRKPHNHRFMIQCDSCEDWFHGSCVGVTRQQGQQLEKLKKEWKCPNCIKGGPANTSERAFTSHSTPKSISNEKKEGQKRPFKKEDQDTAKRKESTPLNVGSRKMQTSSVLQKQLTADAGTRRKNGEFVPNTNANPPSKQMAKSKDEFVNKNIRTGVRKAQADKSQNGKNSVVTKAFTPQKTSTPQPAKKTTPSRDNSQKNDAHLNVKTRGISVVKEKITKDVKKKNGCVSCDKTATPGSCYCSNACIEKHANECLKLIRESKSSSKVMDLNLQRLVVFDRLRGTVIAGDNSPTASEIIPWLKSNSNFMIACTSSDDNKTENSEERSSDRREDDETAKETVRLNVRKTLKNILEERCKNADDLNVPEEDVRKIALRIEEELHLLFRDNSFKYRAKYRSLMFNIKDPRNQGLFRKILQGKIPPDRLVKMSTEELASVQLAKWREQENQHCLDMIKRVQLEQLKTGGGLLIKKTHKGEVEIEDEATGVIEQDVPKPSSKVEDEIPEVEKVDLTEMAKDTTHLHRSHLFDLNCKVCTGKMAPPPAEEVTAKKVRVAHSISVDFSSPSTMDSVEKSVSRVVDGKSPLSSTGDDSVDHSTISNGTKKPQNVKKSSTSSKSKKKEKVSSKLSSSVWKGFIFMQDVAKFVTSAYKVSGHTEHLHQDIPDSVQVCGRIKPDQVWDYLSKIKQSGNKELIIIRFQAANDEESATYNSFYNYLNSRKRYGVVNNSSKKIKDFYILPLPATSPVPIVLMPFEGPGLPSHRPHMLLGVIVCHKVKQGISAKKQVVKETAEVVETAEGSFTPPLDTRSYTPPLPTTEPEEKAIKSTTDLKKKVFEENNVDPYIPVFSTSNRKNEDIEFYEPSYTPPLETMPKSDSVIGKEDDKPYDPEQDISHLLLTDQEEMKSASMESKNNIPLSSPVNLEKHKKILDELTRQCEETDRQVAALQQFIAAPVNPDAGIQQPFDQALDVAQVSATGMSSFLDLPKNLQDILNVVRQKSFEQEQIIQDVGDVDMRSSSNLPASVSFRSLSSRDVDIRPKFKDDSDDRTSSQGATPPLDEEPESSVDPRPSDPRIKLRTTFQDGEAATVPLSSLSASELVERAQKELAEMEAVEQVNQLSQIKSGSSKKLQSGDWTQYKEPPPPGIEPSDAHASEAMFTSKLPNSPHPPLPPSYASTSEAQLGPHFPPTLIAPPPFQAHIPPPPLFAMQLPPPNVKNCLPPAVVQAGYLPPLPPSPHMKKDMSSHSQEEGWGTWQLPPGHSVDGEWEEGPPRWNEEEWNQGPEGYPPDFYPDDGESRYYPSDPPGDYYDESESRSWGRPSQRHDRDDGWYKRFNRDERQENRWRGRRRPFTRRRGNNRRN